ncbi:hypothetical protein M141_4126 [Bacteroides fragilis str. S38L5]|nr:hypothetical protein M141_4126 [Bacteroides fragilis str. S38L5]
MLLILFIKLFRKADLTLINRKRFQKQSIVAFHFYPNDSKLWQDIPLLTQITDIITLITDISDKEEQYWPEHPIFAGNK